MASLNLPYGPNAVTQLVNNGAAVVKSPVSIDQNLSLASNNEQKTYSTDKFWPRPNTDVTKWDTLCPYQLIVVQAKNDYTVDPPLITYTPYLDYQYTLPLPPEAMSLGMPFAMQPTVTLDGVVEEDNAVPLRPLSFSGTFGFLPSRLSGASKSDSGALGALEDNVQSIFGGVINNINSALAGSGPVAYNVYSSASFTTSGPDSLLINTSGFKQMTLLRDFLESYAYIKKTNSKLAKTLRLAVAIWKEDQVFLVTPNNFNVTKDSSSALEYRYNLSFTAWKRVVLNVGSLQPGLVVPAIRTSPSLLNRALNTINAARQALQTISALNQSILGDTDYIFKPLNDTILLCKDAQGAALSLQDIPNSIANRLKINLENLKYSNPALWAVLASNQTTKSSIRAMNSLSISTVPVDTTTIKTPIGPGAAATSNNRSPKILIKDILPDLASQIPVASLNITQDIKNDLNNNIQRVRALRRQDFEDYANTLRLVADKVAFLFGAGDPTYAATYGINIVPIKSEPTQSDWDSLNALNDSVDIMQQFAATADGEPEQSVSFIDQFGELANTSGIAWTTPVSKFAIPFPYGSTIEGLATTYLGDPNRFLEIIALNGLRAPYIDEIGYTLPLLINGKDFTIVAAYNSDLYVGKVIWLSSNAANIASFKIASINTSNSISTIKLNNNADSYKVSDNAVLQTFLTATVNSKNLIWIPSNEDPLNTESVITKDIPGVDVTDPMVNIGGVDLLLDNTNDLVLVNNDLRYAIGLANIIQWIKYVFMIKKGELLQHRDIGLPLSIGLSLADFKATDVVSSIKETLSQDSTFSRVDYINVNQNGPSVSIKIGVVIAGTAMTLPLTYTLNLQ